MTGLAVVLILISAFAHASWNLMVRRSDSPELTNWMMLSSGAVLASPFALFLLITRPPDPVGWLFVAGTVALHIAYFFLREPPARLSQGQRLDRQSVHTLRIKSKGGENPKDLAMWLLLRHEGNRSYEGRR